MLQLRDFPPRLLSLLEEIQAAGSNKAIMDALEHCLSSMHERTNFYQWTRRDRDGFRPLHLSSVRAGGPFHSFLPEAYQTGGAGGYIESGVDAMDEIDEGDKAPNGEEVGVLFSFHCHLHS